MTPECAPTDGTSSPLPAAEPRADRSDYTDKHSPAQCAGLFVFVATRFAAKHSLPKRADVARPTAPSHTSPLRPNFPPRLDENTDKDLFSAPDRRQHRQIPSAPTGGNTDKYSPARRAGLFVIIGIETRKMRSPHNKKF